jgi:hypothetical protein
MMMMMMMVMMIVVKSLCLSKHHAMKTDAGVEVQIHEFLTLALDQVGGELHAPAALRPGKYSSVPI